MAVCVYVGDIHLCTLHSDIHSRQLGYGISTWNVLAFVLESSNRLYFHLIVVSCNIMRFWPYIQLFTDFNPTHVRPKDFIK